MTDSERAKLYLRRAMQLRCPECGVSPLFVRWRNVRSFYDWLVPLDGCSRCGYAYQRESGYWLLATWVINYTLVAGLGLSAAIFIDSTWHPAFWKMCVAVFVPMPILSLALVRHAKSLFLAIDHYCDPHHDLPVKPRSEK